MQSLPVYLTLVWHAQEKGPGHFAGHGRPPDRRTCRRGWRPGQTSRSIGLCGAMVKLTGELESKVVGEYS